VFDESRYGAGAGGGARKQGWTATQPARVPQRASDHRLADAASEAQIFAVGGNETTLAFINSLRPDGEGAVTARLIPIARTPLGVALGDSRQEVAIPLAGLFEWVDRTFPGDDERAFISSMRDLELLARIGWDSHFPDSVDERSIVNLEDLPEDVADGLASPPVPLVACAACRRLCVRDDFIWKEKQLCAWDFHAQVFGRRGPWHNGPYEERHFETLPVCSYVAHPLLAELGVEPVMAGAALPEATARAIVNLILEADLTRPHLAVRTALGLWVLREKSSPSEVKG
jgi:hypothetical protein